MKQLKQLEKQRKDLMGKLKQQEKKVCQEADIVLVLLPIESYFRLTILSVQNVLKRYHCYRSTARSKLRVIVGCTRSKRRRE